MSIYKDGIEVDSTFGVMAVKPIPRFSGSVRSAGGGHAARADACVRNRGVYRSRRHRRIEAAVVVFEAMKMQRSVTASAAGVVESVGVKVGEQVKSKCWR